MRPKAAHPYLDHDGVLAFAHRGGDRVAPENTMAAFHDDNLARMVGEDVAISNLTAAEIDKLKVHGEHHIPTMLELFETFPEARINIDAKAWPVVEPLIALINQTQAQGRICIGSFSDARIKQVVKNTGNVCHSVGPLGAARFRFAAWGHVPLSYSAGAVQFPVREYGVPMVTKASVAYAHKCGLQVHVWTINNESTMHELLDLGVDGLMTDDCALLKKVLQARNLW